MTPIRGLFETHLTVSDLDRSIRFYRDALHLPVALVVVERRVAFFWVGAPGQAMIGLWESASGPQRMRLHTAFEVLFPDLLASPEKLRGAGIEPLDFFENPATEPSVLAWMPAAAVYFHDPDGNLLEFITMLDQPARPERGILPWSEWAAPAARVDA